MDKIKYLDEYGVSIIADEVQKALESKADGSAGVALRAEGDENGLNIAENYALAKNIPTKTSDLENDSLFVSNQTLQNGLNKKVDKIDGKTLTTHDFTTEYKNKLDSIEKYTLPQATSTVLGGIKTGYTTTGKTYAVVTDANGNAYVAVPWEGGEDTNTTYTLEQTGDVIKLVGSDGSSSEVTVVTEEVTLASLGITATSKELNILSGASITTDELNALSNVSSNIQSQLDTKVPNTRKINGKVLSSDITLTAEDVDADAAGSAAKALSDAKEYVDAIPDATTSASGHMSAADKSKLDKIAENAEVNQNAFSKIAVGTTTIAADSKTDTLTLEAGANVTLTADATGDKVTIAATDTKYSAGTGIGISGTSISNTGVRSIEEGTTNGTISVNTGGTTKDVSVKGLGSAAYTASSNYATAAQGVLADAAMPKGGGTFTGEISGPAPTKDAHLATKSYVDTKLSGVGGALDALVYKGTLGTNGTITELPTTYKIGWTYRIITAGSYAGQVCEVGDLITAIVNRSGTGNANSDWTVAQTNINGALTAANNGLHVSGTTVQHDDYLAEIGTVQGSEGAISFGGNFTIPKITYNKQGHITGVSTTTVNMPKGPFGSATKPVYFNESGIPTACSYSLGANVPSNAIFTDQLVKQTPTSSDGTFPVLLAPSTISGETTTSAYFTSSLTINPNTGALSATSFSGSGSGLTKLNASNISSGTLAVARLPKSTNITAGAYGPSENATPEYGKTFNVPQVTVDEYGRVVGISTRTVQIPASDNTDTKNTAGSTDSSKKLFLIGAETQGANPQTYSHDTAYVGTDGCLYSGSKKVMVEGGTYPYVKLDGSTPMTGDLTFNVGNEDRFITFNYTPGSYSWRMGYLGSGTGDENFLAFQSEGTSTDDTWSNALKLGLTSLNATFGGNILPTTTEAQTIGSSSLKFANIYATTFTGNLSGNATTASTANKLASSTDKGSSDVPVYFKNGVPVACSTLSVGTTGNAGSATKLTTDAGDSNTPVYFSGGKPVACTSLDLNTSGNAATATTSSYQTVLDVRDAQRLPSYFTEKRLTAYFNNTGMPGSGWHSGIHIKGWGAGYQSWELASGSTTSLNGLLYYRNGIDDKWEDWKQIAFITDNVASATKASKLSNTAAVGSAKKPVYFSANGVPVEGTYTLGDACQKSYVDSTSSSALGTGDSLVTERDVYYGLVTVNGAAQARANGIYAPTSAGVSGQILVSSGGIPTWKNQTTLAVNTASKLAAPVKLTVGNTGKNFDGSGPVSWSLSEIGALPTSAGSSYPITGVLYFKNSTYPGDIIAMNASGQKRYELWSASNTGAVAAFKVRVFTTEDGSTYKDWTFGTDGVLTSPGGFSGNASSATTLSATLAIDKGGTGATTAANARTNLGLGSAATYSATSSITSGSSALVTSGAVYTGLAGKLNTTGGSLSGALTINTSIATHTSPTGQCLVINSSTTPSGTTLGLANAPGIGFHITNVSWGSMIFDGAFKFVNNTFNGYMPVYASTFYGALSGNASTATALTTSAGSATQPIYFSGGKPVACGTSLAVSITGNAATANTASLATAAGTAEMKLYSQNSNEINFGGTSNSNTIYFGYRAADKKPIPTQFVFGGSTGSATLKATAFTGTAAKLARSGDTSVPMTFYWSGKDGQPTWLWGGSDGSNMYVYNPSNFSVKYATSAGSASSATSATSATSSTKLSINNTANVSDCLQYMQPSSQTTGKDLPTSTWWHVIKMNHGTGDSYYKRLLAFDFWNDDIYTSGAAGDGVTRTWKRVWVEGNSVTGAVWNDYAECRQSDTEDFGYVLTEVGDDTLTKTTERLQHFAGISSDTWGFSQGETSNAKTPIAVAGRVLAYPYQPRENYHPGDCVCAAPGGMVDIMTREEVINYSDRIVGTVSCVPDYDEWGGGETADRPSVKVNGRIWIKVR